MLAATDIPWVTLLIAIPAFMAGITGVLSWMSTRKRDTVTAEQADREQNIAELREIAAQRAGMIVDLRVELDRAIVQRDKAVADHFNCQTREDEREARLAELTRELDGFRRGTDG